MVRYAPAGGRYKVVILDEAHMLTDEASNALLKTLEEPPDKVIFIMATTQPEDLADTIRSRSQHFHFRALSFAEISDALNDICAKENLTAEPGAHRRDGARRRRQRARRPFAARAGARLLRRQRSPTRRCANCSASSPEKFSTN